MNLKELAVQYRESAAACRERAAQLQRMLSHCDGGSETMSLRRRISILNSMAAETVITAKYLENYYERDDKHGGKMQHGGDGVSEVEELCAAVGKLRRPRYANCGRADGKDAQRKAEENGGDVLYPPASHARDRKSTGRKPINGKQNIEVRQR